MGIHNPNASSVKLILSTDVDVLLPASDEDKVTNQTNVGVDVSAGVTFTLKQLMSFTFKDSFKRDLLIRE